MAVVLVYLAIRLLQQCISKQLFPYRLCEIHIEDILVFRLL